MKQIENIFSKTKTKKSSLCPNPKTPIILDTRENNSLIKANLIQQSANFQEETLEIGDYLISNTVIERKTYKDFLSSLKDKRLFNQINQMKKYSNQFLILEGFDFSYSGNFHKNAIRGSMLSLANLIPIIYTENETDTTAFLIQIAKRQTKESRKNISLRETKSKLSIEEKKQFILEGFPGIGPTIAKSLLINFKSLKHIFNAKKEDLQEIKKLDKNKINSFLNLLN